MGDSVEIAKYQTVWQSFVEGNNDALSVIYFDFFDVLLGFGMKYTSDRCLVEDCIQNLFVGLLKTRSQQCEIRNIKLFLLKGLKNQLAYEKRRTKNLLVKENAEENDFRISNSIETLIIDNENTKLQKDFLKKVEESLSNKQREALYLKYVCELSYVEIAGFMNVKVESVRTLIYRTLKTLSSTFGNDQHASVILWSLSRVFLSWRKKVVH